MQSATETLITPEMELEDFWARAQAGAAIWLPFASSCTPILMMSGEKIIFHHNRLRNS